MFPVSKESKLESLLQDRGQSPARPRGPRGAAPPTSRGHTHRSRAGLGASVEAGASGPLSSTPAPVLGLCLQEMGALVTRGTRASGLSLLVTASRKPPSPAPRG